MSGILTVVPNRERPPDPSTESGPDQMIESVHIENFRCFESAEAKGLGLINVVVGDNGVGKTAFLESLFLLATNTPEAHVRFLRWRGVLGERLKIESSHVTSGKFWADLFWDYSLGRPIVIDAKGHPNRKLAIRYTESGTESVGSGPQKAPIAFTWYPDNGDIPFESIPTYEDQRLIFPVAPSGVITGAFISDMGGPFDLVARFSQLDIEGEWSRVEEVIKKQFPEIQGLSMQDAPTGGSAMYAKLRGHTRKIPLPLVSAGINRLVFILSTIACFPQGAVFIDEYAKGLYHRRLRAVWESIHEVAASNKTQVFVATHSGEAIEALGSLIDDEHEKDLRLVRITRDAGNSTIRVSSGRNLAAAIKTHTDIR